MSLSFSHDQAPKVCPECKRNNIREMRCDSESASGKFMCNYAVCRANDVQWYVMKPPHIEKTYSLDEVLHSRFNVGEFTLFIQSLFIKYTQVRFHPMLGKDDNFGYLPTKDAIHFPFEIPTVAHQVGHMVEMTDESRWVKPDWGLANYGERRNIPPKSLAVALAREQRVRAIQSLIPGARGQSVLVNAAWDGFAKNALPFLRFKTYEEVVEWTDQIWETTIKNWNLDRIESEWHTRMEYVLNWVAK